jgi:CRISPR/Cas system-associated exonuclease Cas4 (RecB family)
VNIIDIYDRFIDKKRKENEKTRYLGQEKWLHASAAGSCARKQYYKHVDLVPEKPFSTDVQRLFRLGNIVHDDIQCAINEYAINENVTVFIEQEILIPEWNVRGFLDMVIVDDNELYDIKTCNTRKFKILSGKLNVYNEPKNYYLQLATYAYWYEQKNGKQLDKMALVFYNKDNSDMMEMEVRRSYITEAKTYWETLKNEFFNGVPEVSLGFAPMKKWECNYCNYFDHCGEGFGDGKR